MNASTNSESAKVGSGFSECAQAAAINVPLPHLGCGLPKRRVNLSAARACLNKRVQSAARAPGGTAINARAAQATSL